MTEPRSWMHWVASNIAGSPPGHPEEAGTGSTQMTRSQRAQQFCDGCAATVASPSSRPSSRSSIRGGSAEKPMSVRIRNLGAVGLEVRSTMTLGLGSRPLDSLVSRSKTSRLPGLSHEQDYWARPSATTPRWRPSSQKSAQTIETSG